jgi:trimethylamine--corrinoid protein Co-methyltransferase
VLLDRQSCERIHQAAVGLLGELGVRVDDPGVVRLLCDAGARVRCENVVQLPSDLVEWALAGAPHTIRLADRVRRVWELGPDGGTVVLTGNALYLTRGKQRRELTACDLSELARVVDACGDIHGMVGAAVCDYPPASRDFVGFRIISEFTGKHLRPCIYTPRGARLVIEMAQVLAQGVPLRERPIVSTGFSILSPLHWTALALGVFRATAGYGLPVMINSEPLAGATAPVSLAGCLVIGEADVLSGLVINQLLEPGRPCIYNLGFAHVMDMASAIALTGAPENTLLQAAGAELARFHRLPSASWMSTEAVSLDGQAAFEKMMTGLLHASAGVNIIWGAGNLESTLAMCPEALVVDDEIAAYFLRLRRGLKVDQETMALEVIRQVGLGGDFLSAEHTLENYREILSRPKLAFRNRRSIWEAAGSKTLEDSARERVNLILSGEPRIYVSDSQKRELRVIEASALSELDRGADFNSW